MTAASGLRVAAFAALAALAAVQWASLVGEPPAARVAAMVAIAAAGAAAFVSLGHRELPRAAVRATAWGLAAAILAVGALASGIGLERLLPSGWADLLDGIGQGMTGLADAEYPYEGQNPWVRQVILLALPIGLGAAAALAFWPTGRRRNAGLVLLIALYGVAVTVSPPAEPLLWGVALLALLAAWLWLPRLEGRRARAAIAVGLAAVAGVGAAAALDAEDPWIDWTAWSWPGDDPAVKFRWNHAYGPIDWPRDGTALLRAESDEPHYWRTIQLDYFNGLSWEVATERLSIERPLELPADVEGAAAGAPDPDWLEEVKFTIGALDSGLLVTPGPVADVQGLDGVTPGVGGTSLVSEPLHEGDEYTVTAYVPQPSADRLRAAPPAYPRVLRRYTQLELPDRLPVPEPESGLTLSRPPQLSIPLYGGPPSQGAEGRLRRSLYREVHGLAERLTAGAPTTYDAVTAIETHLRRNYAYSETPPARDVPLVAFLFGDRTGYCQQFSGAMALMLRTLGIPSRVASGFSSGERERDGTAFQVRDSDAHSWVEVYFNGIGWVPFEPTPPAAPAGEQLAELLSGREIGDTGGGTVIPRRGLVVPTVAGPPEAALAAADSGGGPWGALRTAFLLLLALLAVAAVAVAAILARRSARFRRLQPADAANAQARELEAALPMLGFPIPAGSTLRDLERRFRGRPALTSYMAALGTSRFGVDRGVPPGAAERRRLRRELGADRGLAGRLRALVALPPGAPRP